MNKSTYLPIAKEDILYPTNTVAILAVTLAQQGKNITTLLQDCGIKGSGLFSLSGKISFNQFQSFVQKLLATSPNPSLPFDAGLSITTSVCGMYGCGIANSPTYRASAEFASRYQIMIGPLATGEFFECENAAAWIFNPILTSEPEDPLYQFSLAFHACAIFALSREVFGADFRLTKVTFRHSAPLHVELYRKAFQCPVEFGHMYNSLNYETAWLNRKLPSSNPIIMPVTIEYCENALSKILINGDIEKKVRLILAAKPDSFPTIDTISNLLAMHPRTLRRRLDMNGTTYREVLSDVKKDLAIKYLKETPLSYTEIATRLGFSDSTSLKKAFLRWTGQQMGDYRLTIN